MKKPISATLLVLMAAMGASADPRDQRTAIFREGIKTALAATLQEMARPSPTPTTRDLPNATLAMLALGQDPREAERLTLLAFSHQDMDPSSPAYGTLPWRIGHPEIKDANSVEFCAQPIGPVFLHYGGLLSDSFKQKMLPHLRAMAAAVRRHNVAVTYTNIFLMKTVNMILLGEVLGDVDLAREGHAQLDQWLDHTRAHGIREFASPNYYAVNLNSLLMGYLCGPQSDVREKFKRILDFFWADIAANYFPGRGSLSGAHSRDYEFLRGHESIELCLYQESLRPTPFAPGPAIGRIYLLQNELAGGYRPPPEILRLAALPERVVEGRWDPRAGCDRYNYITPDFAMGSASTSYGGHDKLINLELASELDLPAITVVPDITGRPYGERQFKDRSGHDKPWHPPLNPACVQEKGTLLALLDLDPSALPETASFATNILLPAEADLLALDGVRVPIRGPFEKPARLNSVVGIRTGTAGIAIRFFSAAGLGDRPPVFSLKADETGLYQGVARYTASHYEGAPKRFMQAHLRIGLLFLARRVTHNGEFAALLRQAQDAAITEETASGAWTVSARIDGLTLEAARHPETRQILYRRIDGRDLQPPVFTVNGRDLAAAILLPPSN